MASTQSAMTPSIATTQNQEYIDLEAMMDKQQAQIDTVQEESNSRWLALEKQVKDQQTTQTERFDTLERKVTKSMRSLTSNNTALTDLHNSL